jgi:undecaprenyl-diphosphatase
MTILQAIILAIVEAVTEFLPVSSTAHLILTGKLLGVVSDDFLTSFEIFIQLGAILAVLVVLGQKIIKSKKMWRQIAVAFVPTVILGALVYKIIKQYLLHGQWISGVMLIAGGLGFIVYEWWVARKERLRGSETGGCDEERAGASGGKNELEIGKEITEISLGRAALIGVAQTVAFVPGVSRSAATMFGGLLVGLKRKAAVEFAFILAIPTMLAASGLDLLLTVKDGVSFTTEQLLCLAVGLVGAFVVSLLTVKLFIKIMSKKNSLLWFGLYRIVIGIVWLVVFLA